VFLVDLDNGSSVIRDIVRYFSCLLFSAIVVVLISDITPQHKQPKILVEVSLVKIEMTPNGTEQHTELPSSDLEGVKVAPIAIGGFVSFKKLKIMSTSQQNGGCCFRLKFRLKGFLGGGGGALSETSVPLNVTALSNPIEVFSHSQYLNNQTAGVIEVRIIISF